MAMPAARANAASMLPTVPLGPQQATQLIAGGNPLYGYSHFNRLFDNLMRDYFTDDQVVSYLQQCEKAGINTWQSNYGPGAQRQMPRIRDAGCTMHWICLADPWDASKSNDPKALVAGSMKCASIAAKAKPIGIAHHGVFTDQHWAAGSIDLVRDFVNHVHDLGIPAGVSTHNPAVIEYIESTGWPVDFYMGCFYRVTRTDDEFKREIGMPPVGETYLAKAPDRMTAALRQAKGLCLGFKILAAGRHTDSKEEVRRCFDYAFRNLKPADAVIVGMFPKYSDQITENVGNVLAVLD